MTQVTVHYDGECPFCTSYARLVKLREHFDVQLSDLRTTPATVERFNALGLDVNEGFVVEVQTAPDAEPVLHHGKDGIHALALMTDGSVFGWINRLAFSSKALNRLLYPVLKFCRNMALRLLGRDFIEQPGLSDAAAKN